MKKDVDYKEVKKLLKPYGFSKLIGPRVALYMANLGISTPDEFIDLYKSGKVSNKDILKNPNIGRKTFDEIINLFNLTVTHHQQLAEGEVLMKKDAGILTEIKLNGVDLEGNHIDCQNVIFDIKEDVQSFEENEVRYINITLDYKDSDSTMCITFYQANALRKWLELVMSI